MVAAAKYKPLQRRWAYSLSHNRTYCICWVSAFVVLAGVCTPAWAQSNLTTIPIDPNAPDVVERRESLAFSAPSAALQKAQELGLPSDQFFAAIDPERQSGAAEFAAVGETEAAAAQDCPIDLIDSDPSERRGWFQVNYGAPCNMSLYCNWIVDTKADLPDLSRAQERSMEDDESSEPSEEDSMRVASEFSAIADADNDHTHGYAEISMKLVLAGTRACNLTRYCDGRDDFLCTEKFLKLKAEQISIQQLGR